MSHPGSLDDFAYPFTPKEFARLEMYRAAIRAGLYTDQIDGPTPIENTRCTVSNCAIERALVTDRSGPERAWSAGGETNGMD